MLSRLHVRNYVLIDSLEIEFPEGLIIITGQTGAGKSILLGALSLLTGSKADASMIAQGAENCVVEAEFEVGDDRQLKEILDEQEVEWEDGHLIIRRTVARSGRSRSFVNDSPVPVQVLQSISSRLVDVHSQHQTLMLSDKQFQLGILDHYAGNARLREECVQAWRNLVSLKSDLAEAESRLQRLAAEKEYNESQYRQLETAAIRDGELAELEEEQRQLANAEEIKMCLSGVEDLFTAESSADERLSLDVLLKEADKLLVKAGRYVPSAVELAERVASCRHELDDILSDVASLNSRTELSAERLEAVESRMSLLYGLMQKHGCLNESELISLRDSFSDKLFDSTRLEEQCESLRNAVSVAEEKLQDIASSLHVSRMASKDAFASTVCESIRSLELPHAVFEVALLDSPLSATGLDSVRFRFSASGADPVDVDRCASGGEMSRIMLSLKAMMARYTEMPTMIFDEIDTGVSGSVADKMGSMICEMGAHMQVFAITHLPQVAAKGSAHYLVSKEIDTAASRAYSTITRLSDEERVMELARMLSGSVLTDAAVANAKSLLQS
ncbi:MAG: DNA repair protein RecN [Bacteroidales bacterium]|nr:DNA repair protein RecN [Bacteroidales bacterium]